MNNLFCSPEQSLAILDLGFNEPCLGFYDGDKNDKVYFNNLRDGSGDFVPFEKNERLKWFAAPLKSHFFEWVIKKHGLIGLVNIAKQGFYYFDINLINPYTEVYQGVDYDDYKEAEDACINELIKLIKQNSNYAQYIIP